MPTYSNGYVPEELLVIFARGANTVDGVWYHGLPAATYARHLALVARAKLRTGRDLRVADGWGAYRPYHAQLIARQVHGKYAATPGTSSHGLLWERRQVAAIDYSNWAWVYAEHGGRAAFYADVRAVGLTPGLISPERGYPDEPWHVVDENPWGAVPAFEGVTDFVVEESGEDDIMKFIDGPNIIVWPNGVINSYPQNVYTVIKQYVNYPTHQDWSGGRSTFEREAWAAFNAGAGLTAAAVARALPAGSQVDVGALAKAVAEAMPKTFTVVASG